MKDQISTPGSIAKKIISMLVVPIALAGGQEFKMNELSDILKVEKNDTWSISEERGAALYENLNTPGAITYSYVHPKPGQAGQRTITVDVEMLTTNPNGHAGILYAFENDPRSYFLFTVAGDQSVNLNYFDRTNGLQERMKMSLNSKVPKTKLTIREKGNEIELLVNGVMKSGLGNNKMGRGAVGIVTVDKGKFRLSNFDISIPDKEVGSPESTPLKTDFPAIESADPSRSNTPQTGDATSSHQPRETSPSKKTNVFRRHHVTDPGMNNINAFSVLIPESWHVEGGLSRSAPQLFQNPLLLDLAIEAPDGRGAHFHPSLSFEFSQQQSELLTPTRNGNLFYPLPSSPGAWLMELAQKFPDPGISNLRLISEKTEPNLTRTLKQQAAPLEQTLQQTKEIAAQSGISVLHDTQATIVTLQYTWKGIKIEESVLIAWQYMLNKFHGKITGGKWQVPLMLSSRGPVGSDYPNDPELVTIFSSFQANSTWTREMNKHWAKMAEIRHKGSVQINKDWQKHHAKMQQLRNETSAIIAGGHQTREAIRDAGHRKQVDAIHEVTPYLTSSGETVQLPSFYRNVYTDGNDRFILTNDLLNDPRRELNLPGSWERISAQ